jgi:hypothetical protein
VFELETSIAGFHWDNVTSRDSEDLQPSAPGMPSVTDHRVPLVRNHRATDGPDLNRAGSMRWMMLRRGASR